MNNDITGSANEFEFVKYLNGKKISELNPLFTSLINKLFPFENKNLIIKSWRNHYSQKSDVFIKINGQIRGISIKKGIKNSVHVERISDFIKFLNENNIENETINEYLKYHYADGTLNGTGKKRLTIEEYKEKNQYEIDKINQIFNKEEFLNKAIDRFVLKGNNSDYYIDAIVYGEVNDFIFATRKEIRNIILSKKDNYSSAIHFGPLTCQPKNRCLNYNPKYEKDRFCIQIKWYSIFDDIIENMNNKINKKILELQ